MKRPSEPEGFFVSGVPAGLPTAGWSSPAGDAWWRCRRGLGASAVGRLPDSRTLAMERPSGVKRQGERADSPQRCSPRRAIQPVRRTVTVTGHRQAPEVPPGFCRRRAGGGASVRACWPVSDSRLGCCSSRSSGPGTMDRGRPAPRTPAQPCPTLATPRRSRHRAPPPRTRGPPRPRRSHRPPPRPRRQANP